MASRGKYSIFLRIASAILILASCVLGVLYLSSDHYPKNLITAIRIKQRIQNSSVTFTVPQSGRYDVVLQLEESENTHLNPNGLHGYWSVKRAMDQTVLASGSLDQPTPHPNTSQNTLGIFEGQRKTAYQLEVTHQAIDNPDDRTTMAQCRVVLDPAYREESLIFQGIYLVFFILCTTLAALLLWIERNLTNRPNVNHQV